MSTDAGSKNKLLYGELSYKLNGLLFAIHNELGTYAREKQYGDLLALKLDESNILFRRECIIGDSGNIADFIIENVIILELKAKPFLLRSDYEQVQRYLYICNLQLGLLVNFRSRFLQPKRILHRDYL